MHRLTRYSIRSLLVLVTLACVALGWYVVNRNVRQREVAAIEEIATLMRSGSSIDSLEEGMYPQCGTKACGAVNLRLLAPRWAPTFKEQLFSRVVKITLWESLDDRAIPHLAQLKSLEEIHFSQSRLSEDGKAQLRTLFPDATIEFETQPEPDPDDPFG